MMRTTWIRTKDPQIMRLVHYRCAMVLSSCLLHVLLVVG